MQESSVTRADWTLTAGAAVIAFSYTLAFFATDAARWQGLLALLLPDDLLAVWCAGDLAAFSLFDRLPILAGVAVNYATAWLAGRLALAALGVRHALDRWERGVFAIGVGLSLMSLFALAVGLTAMLQQRWVFVGAAVAVVVGNLGIWVWQRRISSNVDVHSSASTAGGTPAPLRRDDDRRWYWLLLAAAPFALAMLLGAMLPPWEYDVREYHLQVPKEWFRGGRIEFLPHNIYGNMPLGSEMTALWGMALFRGDDAWWWGALDGKTAMAGYSLVTAAALVAFGRRVHSLAAGVIAAVVFLSTPWIVVVGQIGHNEGPVAMYALLALYALWLARGGQVDGSGKGSGVFGGENRAILKDQPPPKTPDPLAEPSRNAPSVPLARRFVVLSGFLAGSAVACKYPPALFLVVPLAAWIGFSRSVPRRIWNGNPPSIGEPSPAGPAGPTWREAALQTAIFLAAAGAACGLWLGKNAVLAENPTYPLLYDIFGGRTRTPEKDEQWTQVHAPQPDTSGSRFSLAQLTDAAALVLVRTKWASVALLPLAGLAWLAVLVQATRGGWGCMEATPAGRGSLRDPQPPSTYPQPPSARILGAGTVWVAFVLAAWWLTTHRIDRFLVLLLPIACLAAGMGAVAFRDRPWRTVTLLLLGFSLLVHFPLVATPVAGDVRFFAPLAALRLDVPDEDLPPEEQWYGHRVHPAHRWINEHVPAGKRVLLVGDAQPFDLVPVAVYNTCFDDCQFTRIFQGRTRGERLESLRAENISHVFIHWGELARFRGPANYGYTSDYPTPELVHGELVGRERLLRPIPLPGVPPQEAELFVVAAE